MNLATSVKFWGGPWDGREFCQALYDRMPRCIIPPPGTKGGGYYWAALRDHRYEWRDMITFPSDDACEEIDCGVDIHEWHPISDKLGTD